VLQAVNLRETGTTHWLSPNEGATNETGFTAVPGGYRSAMVDSTISATAVTGGVLLSMI